MLAYEVWQEKKEDSMRKVSLYLSDDLELSVFYLAIKGGFLFLAPNGGFNTTGLYTDPAGHF